MATTKQQRLLEALQRGEELTSAQITSRYNIPNPSATVNDLREAGHNVFSTRRETKNGIVSKYHMKVRKSA
jgi:hypothetical protein